MDAKAPPLVNWPTPTQTDVVIAVVLVLFIVTLYSVYRYYKKKERIRAQNNTLFLRHTRRKGLNDEQLKLLKKMIFYLQLQNPMDIISNTKLFESNLTDFIGYLQDNAEDKDYLDEDELEAIFRDFIFIIDRLFGPKQLKIRIPINSMAEIEIGEVLYIKTETDEILFGKIAAKKEDCFELYLFISPEELKYLEDEINVSIHIIKPDDAEYLIQTVTMGINPKSNLLLVKNSDDFTKVREFRHPYIDVMIPAYITIYSQDGTKEPENFECTIFKINEEECIMRVEIQLEYEKEYPVSFEIDGFKYNVYSRMISLKTIGKDKVYYSILKFVDMTEEGKKIIIKKIAESEQF